MPHTEKLFKVIQSPFATILLPNCLARATTARDGSSNEKRKSLYFRTNRHHSIRADMGFNELQIRVPRFNSGRGLQPSLLRSFGSQAQLDRGRRPPSPSTHFARP